MAVATDFRLFLITIAAVILTMEARHAEGSAPSPRDDCNRMCGDLPVPYPFGMENDISKDCYLRPGFQVKCNYTFNPPKLFQGNVEVDSISISNNQITFLLHLSYICYDSSAPSANWTTWTITLPSPYTLSVDNVFTAVGCETLAQFRIGDNNFAGCMSGCSGISSVQEGSCSGIGCCQASIPHGVRWYDSIFYGRNNTSDTYLFNPCSYSFFVRKDNYSFSIADLTGMDTDRVFPVVHDFTVQNQTCEEAKANSSSYACASTSSECADSPSHNGYYCNCSLGYEGNPYVPNGCLDIDECKLSPNIYPCYGNCTNLQGSYNCSCPQGYFSKDPKKIECTLEGKPGKSKLPLGALVAIGVVGAILIILLLAAIGCLDFQRRKINNLKKKNFDKNGGSHLRRLIANNTSNFEIFSMEQLQKATKNFHTDQLLGTGGYGTVYKGVLDDARVIAVKKPIDITEKNGQDFANELFILSQVNHKNIVELLGCCLEDKIPMLVYKYIPRGTLHDYIHARNAQRIPFATRLRIVTEAAEALKYLHEDVSTPILHGDIKSANILLDEGDIAKISDFGTSKLTPKDKKDFTALIQGTRGYLDPEYMLIGYLTAPSDVYSFGVVLVELMTRKLPLNLDAVIDQEKSLAYKFITCMKNNRLEEIVDPEIIDENLTYALKKVLDLAMRCLSRDVTERPTMGDALSELQSLKVHESHPWDPTSNEDGTSLLTGRATYNRHEHAPSNNEDESSLLGTTSIDSHEFVQRGPAPLNIELGR